MKTIQPLSLRATSISFFLKQTAILRDIDLMLHAGEFLGLIGPNGAGKSSLLKILAGLQTPSAGRVCLNDQDLFSLDNKQRAKTIGYLSQQTEAHWPLEVERLVTLGRIPHHQNWQGLQNNDKHAIETAMRTAEVTHLATRTVTSLSGGERLRVMLARVFAGEPSIILADEPTASLDPYHQLHTMELLQDHCRRGGSVVVVLHDLSLAARFCDKLILLNHGQIESQGAPYDVLTEENLANTYGVKSQLYLRDGNTHLDISARIPHKGVE